MEETTGITGHDEVRSAKSWAITHADRMREPVVVVAYPGGNAAAHRSRLRAFVALRPLTFAFMVSFATLLIERFT